MLLPRKPATLDDTGHSCIWIEVRIFNSPTHITITFRLLSSGLLIVESLAHCVNTAGAKYDLPKYVLSNPVNLRP